MQNKFFHCNNTGVQEYRAILCVLGGDGEVIYD